MAETADASTKRNGQAGGAARAYGAALARLVRGEGRRPAGRGMRITPAAVAREAGRSRNPLYTTHRDILDEIDAAAGGRGPGKDLAARVAELEAIIAELRAHARRHAEEKRALAQSENLDTSRSGRAAEVRLAARETASAHKVRSPAAAQPM